MLLVGDPQLCTVYRAGYTRTPFPYVYYTIQGASCQMCGDFRVVNHSGRFGRLSALRVLPSARDGRLGIPNSVGRLVGWLA